MSGRKGFAPIVIIIGGVLVLSLAVVAYFFGTQRSQTPNPNPQTANSTIAPPTAVPLPPTSNAEDINDLILYKHPTLNYSFKYPSDWKLETEQPVAGVETQLQLDLTIKSPDFALTTEGIQFLEKGAEVYIYRSKTIETSIDKAFETDSFAGQIPNSKTETTVDGQKALQYDYSYESTQATDTIFIKNGMYYLVKLIYADMTAKNANFPFYSNLLKSFKTS